MDFQFILIYLSNKKIGLTGDPSSLQEIHEYIKDKPIVLYYQQNVGEFFSYLSHRVITNLEEEHKELGQIRSIDCNFYYFHIKLISSTERR